MLGHVKADFLGINKTPDEMVWELPVTAEITGGAGQLFGGCVVGAAAALLEQVTDRPVGWVTCQFGTGARPGDLIELRAEVVSQGRTVTQAKVHTTLDGQPHTTVLASLGTKQFDEHSPARPMPTVPGPDECSALVFDKGAGGLNDRLDVRSVEPLPTDSPLVDGEPARQTTIHLWFRFDGETSGDVFSVSIAADFFPPALSAAVGRRVFGASLDNTVRFIDRAQSEWILAEMTVDSIRDGIGHGTTYVWTQCGRLLAIATQTCAVSEFR